MKKEKTNPNETETEAVLVSVGEKNTFEEAFAESVGQGLEYISEAVAPILRIYLSDAMSVDVGQIKSRLDAKDAEALEQGLENMLGFGARVFERKMLLSLQAKLGLQFEIDRNFEFAKEVKKAKVLHDAKNLNFPKRFAENESHRAQDEANRSGEN